MKQEWSNETKFVFKAMSVRNHLIIKQRKAAGEQMHMAPLGYKNGRDKQGRSILVKDPLTYKLVKEAMQLRKRGKSIRQICRIMEAKGLRSQQGKRVGSSSMALILKRAKP